MKGDAVVDLKLDTLKRPELQKLAKKYGIKANLRNAKLIEEITNKLKNIISPTSPTTTKLNSTLEKKSLSPNISNISSDVVTIDSISPPPLEDLSFDDTADGAERKTSIRTRNSKTGSRSSSSTRAAKRNAANNQESPTAVIKSTNVTRRGKTRDIKAATTRSRSSSRNRPEKQTPGSLKRKRTPSNKKDLQNVVNTKTFSVPKNRVQSRVSSSAKKPTTTKQAAKRKSSGVQQPPQAKRGRPSTRKSNEAKKINKKVAAVNTMEKNGEQKSGFSSFSAKNIPSFAVKGLTVPKLTTTPTTKMFEKMHQKNFDKMESIDDYQKRKEERIEKLFGSSKKLDRLARPKTPSIVKPVTRPKPNFMSPKPKLAPSTKKSTNKSSAFKPTVTRVTEINTNFGSKRSKLVTPKKVAVSFAKSPKRKVSKLRTPAQKTAQQKRKSTPFRPNTSVINTPQSEKKNTFNLQESLKKPLSWKPHKGPLKKFDDTASKKPNLKERAKTLKQPKLTSREARRAQAKEARAASKSDRMMKKRGLK